MTRGGITGAGTDGSEAPLGSPPLMRNSVIPAGAQMIELTEGEEMSDESIT